MNSTICEARYPYLQNHSDENWCRARYDNWICWPPTPPNVVALMPCPAVKGGVEDMAFKSCQIDGQWVNFTNYSTCIMPNVIKVSEFCLRIGGCETIARITKCIEFVGLSVSFVSLIISLFIFLQHRVLKNNRTKIHKNLFIAILLQVVFRLIIYLVNPMISRNSEQSPYYKYFEICSASLLEYAKTAMFMWMFIEGLYLNNIITVTVFQEYSYIKLYFYVGWLTPLLMTSIWLGTMFLTKSDWSFYFLTPTFWILEGTRSAIIVVNLSFLINILRVLVVKLQESRTSELEQFREEQPKEKKYNIGDLNGHRILDGDHPQLTSI